jgi:hypothetical protein
MMTIDVHRETRLARPNSARMNRNASALVAASAPALPVNGPPSGVK